MSWELCCAVPEDRPAPAFLESEQWQGAGQMDEADSMPLGFDREVAWIGVRLNGFYLFVAFDAALRVLDRVQAQPQAATASPTPTSQASRGAGGGLATTGPSHQSSQIRCRLITVPRDRSRSRRRS